MVTELAYHNDRLPANRLSESLILRIEPASHRKILPDHQPKSVALVEESGVFINVATPATYQIAACFDKKVKMVRNALRIATMEGICGNPVRAFDENRLAIDPEEKSKALIRLQTPVEGDGAKTDVDCARSEQTSRLSKFDVDLIEMGISIPEGPPQLGVVDLNSDQPRKAVKATNRFKVGLSTMAADINLCVLQVFGTRIQNVMNVKRSPSSPWIPNHPPSRPYPTDFPPRAEKKPQRRRLVCERCRPSRSATATAKRMVWDGARGPRGV